MTIFALGSLLEHLKVSLGVSSLGKVANETPKAETEVYHQNHQHYVDSLQLPGHYSYHSTSS